MKGRPLILIFLFLAVLLFFVLPVSADTGQFEWSDSFGDTHAKGISTSSFGSIRYIDSIRVEDVGTVTFIDSVSVRINAAAVSGAFYTTYWVPATLTIGSDTVGTGWYGYLKNADGTISIYMISGDCDLSGYSGTQLIDISSSLNLAISSNGRYFSATGLKSTMAYLAINGGTHLPADGSYTEEFFCDYSYSFTNPFEYYMIGLQLYFNLNRTDSSKVKAIINNSDVELINETTYAWSTMDQDLEFYNNDLGNTTWNITAENSFGDVESIEINFVVAATAEIEFNQTFYTDPENIVVSGEITNMDNDNYVYLVEMTSTIDGDVSSSFFEASGNWNVSPYITFCCGAVMFDFYSDGYDLPVWIQSNLWAKNKNTGVWTKLANTPAVLYHEKSDFGVGSIWTEKSTYNLSEMFYIFVETDYPIVEVELISDTYHDIQSLEVFEGGWQRVGYAFFSPHNFTAYLYEDGVVTNQTSFSVWTTSPMLNIFLDSAALKSQFAFEFYTDNSSDTITGYKPDGSIFYSPITDLETNGREIIRGVSSSSPPGIYTISLFHNGTTYYNDTIELYSTSEYVYFEASKYETGDRIKIYSYVTDSRQTVRLSDSIGTAVITWTDSAGYIVPNGQTVLYFSLTDNNEYGMNINTSLDAGTFRTGNWKVEIIGIDGKSLTDESTYDYTTVSKRIESPADSSNELISIFFSPEGAFILFTVCLIMMGLVAAKHPAGGGAGATVGVGFGTYFNVLPVWMLMLTVILLVVMAGVSIAVYYKGK